MNISTPRFILRPISENDWPFFLALRQDKTLMRYMSDTAQPAEIRALFKQRLKAWQEETFTPVTWIIRDPLCPEQPLGETGIARQATEQRRGEVGYTICAAAQGKGAASEALAALCRYAFDCGGGFSAWRPGFWVIITVRFGFWKSALSSYSKLLKTATCFTASITMTIFTGWGRGNRSFAACTAVNIKGTLRRHPRPF